MFIIAYRVRDKHTNERIGFVLRDMMTGSLRVANLDQALNLANSNMIDSVKVTQVNGKPTITAVGELKLSDIPEITEEGLKSLLMVRKSNTESAQSTRHSLSVVNIYYIFDPATFKRGHGNTSCVYYTPDGNDETKQIVIGYDLMIENTNFQFNGTTIQPGEAFYVPFDKFEQVLLEVGYECEYKNFTAIGNEVLNVIGSVYNIVVGDIDKTSKTFIWDSKLKRQHDDFMRNGYKLYFKRGNQPKEEIVNVQLSDGAMGLMMRKGQNGKYNPASRVAQNSVKMYIADLGEDIVSCRLTGSKPVMTYQPDIYSEDAQRTHEAIMDTITSKERQEQTKKTAKNVKEAKGIFGVFKAFNSR